MANILLLPPITIMDIEIVNNADWRDALAFRNGNDALDISGIDFYAQVRRYATDPVVVGALDLSTKNGYLVNTGIAGILSWNVPFTMMKNVPPGAYIMDLLAVQTPYRTNMMSGGAYANVTVREGVVKI